VSQRLSVQVLAGMQRISAGDGRWGLVLKDAEQANAQQMVQKKAMSRWAGTADSTCTRQTAVVRSAAGANRGPACSVSAPKGVCIREDHENQRMPRRRYRTSRATLASTRSNGAVQPSRGQPGNAANTGQTGCDHHPGLRIF